MDLQKIDSIITRLEKKKRLRPSSPPVVERGHLGVWRTIRQNRMFLEVDSKGDLGRVLIGPPSFVGNKLDDISSETWGNLTPRSTMKEFSGVKVADNGLETLKQSIKNAIGKDDTRRKAVDKPDIKEPMQLVPIARSAGFTDDEIKQALQGKSPNKPLEPGKDVADRRDITGEVEPSKSPEKPRANDQAQIEGALAALTDPDKVADEEDKKVADFLLKIAENVEDELLKRQVKKFAHGVRSGDYSLKEVRDRLAEIAKNKEAAEKNKPSEAELLAIEDKGDIQEFIDEFDDRLDERLKEALKGLAGQFGGNLADVPKATEDRIKIDQVVAMLKDLEKSLNNPELRREVKEVIESVRVNPFSRRSIFLRLYQLLQLLLLFIPLP